MKKFIFPAIVALLILSLTIPTLAATNYPAAINVPNSAATVDGIIEAGEWDEATRIELVYSDIVEDQAGGVPGVGAVGEFPAGFGNDDIWLSVRMKVKDGFLYVLEERKDSGLKFVNDDPATSYLSSGSIIFFWDKAGAALQELSLLADTASKAGPKFAYNESVEISAEEAKATVTDNSFILEAKVALSSIGMTEQLMKDGNYILSYCAGRPSDNDLWGQLQYKGVGFWEQGVPLAVVAGAEWPPAAAAVPEATETPAEAVPVEAAGAVEAVPAASAPAVRTGDAAPVILLAVMMFAALSVILLKKEKFRNKQR